MSEFTFNPALPKPISFKIQDGQYGKQLALFIPTESITHLVDHIGSPQLRFEPLNFRALFWFGLQTAALQL